MPSRILGWAPSQQGEEVDVNSFAPLTFKMAPDQRSLSSQSSDSFYFQDDDDDKKPSRRGDPDWVARPRNAFIIFRCQYCREHSGNGGKSTSPSHNEKTLSKRAGEAWRSLSASEKKHFKALAEKEKIEHAKAHPNYRYRPIKRSPSEKRRRRRQHSSSAVDARSRSRGSSVEDTSPADVPALDESSRIYKRRSTSVPLNPLELSSHLLTVEERDGIRRSKSATNNNLPQYSQWPNYSDNQSQDFAQVVDNTSTYPSSVAANNSATEYQRYQMSPLTTFSSSLAGWNGEPLPPSLSRVPSSSMSTLSSWTTDSTSSNNSSPALMSQQPQHAVYPGGPYAGNTRPHYVAGDSRLAMPMMTQPQYWQNVAGLQSFTGYSRAQYQPDDSAGRAYALQEYNIGLAQRVGAQGEAITFNMRSEEQALFDDFCGF